MTSKYRKGILAAACLSLLLMTGCKNEEPNSVNKNNGGDKSSEPVVEAVQEEVFELTYDLIVKADLTEDQVAAFESKLEALYTYLEEIKFEVPEVTFVLNTYSKVNLQKNQIVLNMDAYSDLELVRSIVRYTYSDEVHYGLTYGFAYELGDHLDLDLETLADLERDQVEDHWDYLFLDYVCFREDIASRDEIKVNKALARSLVKDLIETEGYDAFYKILENSQDVKAVGRTSELIENHVKGLWSDFDLSRKKNPLQFNQKDSDEVISYKMENIDFTISLLFDEQASHLVPTMHHDLETFYSMMMIFDDEIGRLEERMGFDRNDPPTLLIKVYPEESDKYSGVYFGSTELYVLSMLSISHEYIHFLDEQFKWEGKYSMINEMRAEFYSQDFLLEEMYLSSVYENVYDGMRDNKNYFINGKSIIDVAEDYLGRPLEFKDRYKLFADLAIHARLKNGGERFSLYDIQGFIDEKTGYPSDYWISIMNFAIREYGEEEMLSSLFTDFFTDGSLMNLDMIIEDWYEYIENLTEENYGDTYLVN